MIKKELFKKMYALGAELEKQGKVDKIGTGKFQAKYLSWATCLATLKQEVDGVKYELIEHTDIDGVKHNVHPSAKGYEVMIRLHIGDAYQDTRLAVTDSRHQEITRDRVKSTDIQNARQRCLAKAVSEATGLGLHLWTGEDIRHIKMGLEEVGSAKDTSTPPVKTQPAPSSVSPTPKMNGEDVSLAKIKEIIKGSGKTQELFVKFKEAGATAINEASKPTILKVLKAEGLI